MMMERDRGFDEALSQLASFCVELGLDEALLSNYDTAIAEENENKASIALSNIIFAMQGLCEGDVDKNKSLTMLKKMLKKTAKGIDVNIVRKAFIGTSGDDWKAGDSAAEKGEGTADEEPVEERRSTEDGDEYDDEPVDGDYVISDVVRGGCDVGIVDGRHLKHFDELDDAIAFVRQHSKREKFFPNVWYQGERGDINLVKNAYKGTPKWESIDEASPGRPDLKMLPSADLIKLRKMKVRKPRLNPGMVPCSVEEEHTAWLVTFDNGKTILLQSDYDQAAFAVACGKLKASRDWDGAPSTLRGFANFDPSDITQCPDDYLNMAESVEESELDRYKNKYPNYIKFVEDFEKRFKGVYRIDGKNEFGSTMELMVSLPRHGSPIAFLMTVPGDKSVKVKANTASIFSTEAIRDAGLKFSITCTKVDQTTQYLEDLGKLYKKVMGESVTEANKPSTKGRARTYAEYSQRLKDRKDAVSTNASRRMSSKKLPLVDVPELLKPPLIPLAYTKDDDYLGVYKAEDEVPEDAVIKWEEAKTDRYDKYVEEYERWFKSAMKESIDEAKGKEINSWKKSGFSVKLFDTGTKDAHNKPVLGYEFKDGGKTIFKGDDFALSPMIKPTAKAAIYSLLGFFAVGEDDTDPEFFSKYTPAQRKWRDSARCEELSMLVNDFENPNESITEYAKPGDKPTYIKPGEEGVGEMPHSEVCMHMRVAGKVMRFKLSGNGRSVQILKKDGTPFSGPVTTGEAGVFSEGNKFYYYAKKESEIDEDWHSKRGKAILWLRLGDSGDYEDQGQDDYALASALADSGIEEIDKWRKGGFESGSMRGANFVSLFWGDEDANWIADLDKKEQKAIERALSKVVKESEIGALAFILEAKKPIKERWAFSKRELRNPKKLTSKDELIAKVPGGSEVVVYRNGEVTNRYEDGTVSVSDDDAMEAEDVEEFYHPETNESTDVWKDVFVDAKGKFIKFVANESIIPELEMSPENQKTWQRMQVQTAQLAQDIQYVPSEKRHHLMQLLSGGDTQRNSAIKTIAAYKGLAAKSKSNKVPEAVETVRYPINEALDPDSSEAYFVNSVVPGLRDQIRDAIKKDLGGMILRGRGTINKKDGKVEFILDHPKGEKGSPWKLSISGSYMFSDDGMYDIYVTAPGGPGTHSYHAKFSKKPEKDVKNITKDTIEVLQDFKGFTQKESIISIPLSHDVIEEFERVFGDVVEGATVGVGDSGNFIVSVAKVPGILLRLQEFALNHRRGTRQLAKLIRNGEVSEYIGGVDDVVVGFSPMVNEKVQVKVKYPGITGLEAGDFAAKGVPELVKHFIGLAKKIGKPHAMKTILNLERWNKNKAPDVSKKARKVIDALKKSKEWASLETTKKAAKKGKKAEKKPSKQKLAASDLRGYTLTEAGETANVFRDEAAQLGFDRKRLLERIRSAIPLLKPEYKKLFKNKAETTFDFKNKRIVGNDEVTALQWVNTGETLGGTVYVVELGSTETPPSESISETDLLNIVINKQLPISLLEVYDTAVSSGNTFDITNARNAILKAAGLSE